MCIRDRDRSLADARVMMTPAISYHATVLMSFEKQFRLEAVLRKVQQIDGTKKRATSKGGPMFRQNSALTSYACGESNQPYLSPAKLREKKVLGPHWQ